MQIQINIDTAHPLSDYDRNVLQALSGTPLSDPMVKDFAMTVKDSMVAAAQEVAPAPAEKPAPAKKAAAKKAAPKTEPKEEPATEPDSEPEEEPEEDLVGEDSDKTYTLEDAVARATEVLGQGGAAKVKGALTDLGVKRVSELKDKDIPAFMEALA